MFAGLGAARKVSRLIDNFTAIRNGLLDHALAGKLSPFDFGLYIFLIMRASYSSGIYDGCALTIACQFGDPSQKEHVQKSLRRLRDKKYINYRNGDGSRGAYPILINKFFVTVGELSGCRLNAWKHNGVAQPEYERWIGGGTVETLSWHGGDTVVAPNKDLRPKDVQDIKDKRRVVRKRTTLFEPPTLQQVADYCQQRQNTIDPQHWLDYYTSNGWRVGRNPMKDWKAAVRTWEQNGVKHETGNGNGKPSVGQIVEREVAILHARRAQ
jgi:hypothetical protein